MFSCNINYSIKIDIGHLSSKSFFLYKVNFELYEFAHHKLLKYSMIYIPHTGIPNNN